MVLRSLLPTTFPTSDGSRRYRAVRGAAIVLSMLPIFAACGSNKGGGTAPRTVVTNLYVLEWLTQRIGGGEVQVNNLVPPGAEPHDAELTAADTVALADADLAVVLTGIQPSLDDALDTTRTGPVFEAGEFADLLTATEDPLHADEDEEAGNAEGEDADEHAEESGHVDPHFWLDPIRLQQVGNALAEELGAQFPEQRAKFLRNAGQLAEELTTVDSDYSAALGGCSSKNLVTSHTAFTYLADRYGFVQIGLNGLDPTAEPNSSELAALVEHLKESGDVETVYYEPSSGSALAETAAEEIGASTAPLDPLEVAPTPDTSSGDTSSGDTSSGDNSSDVLSTMRKNLQTLQDGQGCG